MKHLIGSFLVALSLAACGGDSEPNNQNCDSQHECVNGACECTTAGREGRACDEDMCVDQCRVCSDG